MKATIFPSQVKGVLNAPSSKSSMQRACAMALISKGNTRIHNAGISMDDKAALSIIKALGAEVTPINAKELLIKSKGVHPVANSINCGELGLSIRMFTPLVALSNKKIIVQGQGSLSTRPMNFFDDIFPQLGIQIKTNEGFLPFEIQGTLQAQNINIDGSLSSQFLTGLILAFISADKKSPVAINVHNLKSKPYIDLTLDVIKKFGVEIKHDNYKKFFFLPTQKLNTENEYTVEGDWSGAAFLLVAAALGRQVTLHHLDILSTQGDKKILEAIKNCGAGLDIKSTTIKVTKKNLNAFSFDATDCPDLFPPLVALASACTGTTTIKGVSRLKHKESDRGETLKTEYAKLGYRVDLKDDDMLIYGGSEIKNKTIEVYSHHDHRIAMSLALAGLTNNNIITIEKADAINKSYPNFFDDIKMIGIKNEYK